jgi:hypothetical protein
VGKNWYYMDGWARWAVWIVGQWRWHWAVCLGHMEYTGKWVGVTKMYRMVEGYERYLGWREVDRIGVSRNVVKGGAGSIC